MRRFLAAALLGMTPVAGGAHALAPGLLELVETEPAHYDVQWRTSVKRARTGGPVEPRLPETCNALTQPDPRVEGGEAVVARWKVACAGGLDGRTLAVDGLPGSGINVIVRVVPRGQPVFQALLGADQPSATLALDDAGVFPRYLALGAQHLVGGLDHTLFVVGLFVLVSGTRALVATVTAFTVGHSVTLCLATLGHAPLPQAVAEMLIAASLLWLGSEVLCNAKRTWTPYLAGAFGLVHGLGFAGALREAGLPAGDVPMALLAFNLGIELAQLLLVAGLALGALAWRRSGAALPGPAFAGYVTGTMAVCWLLERSAALLA